MTKHLLSAILILVLTIPGFAQITKTIHYAFDFKNAVSIDLLGLGGKVEVRSRGGSRILVEMNIGIENGSGVLMDNLIQEGHFDVEMTMDGTVAVIRRKELPINGRNIKRGNDDETKWTPCTETVTYVVYVPPPFVNLVQMDLEQQAANKKK